MTMSSFNRNVFLASRACNSLADQILIFALPLLVYHSTQDVALTAFAYCIEWIPRLIALPLSGAWADRYGPKKLYLTSDLARAAACLTIFCYVLIDLSPNFIVLAVFGGFIGFFHEQAFIALEASVPRIVSSEKIAPTQSLLQGIEHACQILGPALAGLSLAYFDLKTLFAASAVIFVASFFNALNLRIVADRGPTDKASVLSEIKEGLFFVYHSRHLRYLVATTFYVNLIAGAAIAVTPAYIQAEYGRSSEDFATLMTISGIVATLMFLGLPALLRRVSLAHAGLGSLAASVLASIGIGYAPSFVFYVMLFVVIIAADGIFNVYIRTVRIRHIPKESLGKTLGVIVLINLSAIPLSAFLIGTFSKFVGVPAYFVAMGLVGLFPIGVFLRRSHLVNLRRSRRSLQLRI